MEPQYIGATFRVIAQRLRISRGPGRPDLVVERHRTLGGRFTDSDEAPTLVTLDEWCQIDMASLLGTALVPYTAPAPAKAKKQEA